MSFSSSATSRHNLPSQAEQIDWLRDPRSYPDPTDKVELAETHLSWVFLACRFVYKLKKAVRFEFVDFSTLEARRRACHAELQLNRRLTDGVYLDVVAIRRAPDGRLHLGGEGETVDWLVKMRRLPADRMLDEMIRRGAVQPAEVSAVAEVLTRFLASAQRVPVSLQDYLQGFEHRILANYDDLRSAPVGLDPRFVSRIHGTQLRLLHLRRPWFATRLQQGRIVDGHGDLRPEHICLESRPQIFDCIEFRDDFRRVDAIDELGFLAMECEAMGDVSPGAKIIEHYCRATGDRPPEGLLKFHKSYRACVRAKVAALRAAQSSAPSESEHIAHYLTMADRYLAGLVPPVLLVVMGISGSGKSTLAQELAGRLAAEWLQTDAARRELFGQPEAKAGINQGRYSPENRDRVYEHLLAKAEEDLRDGLNVVLDGTFESLEHVTRASQLAKRFGSALLLIECQCPAEVALKRIRGRLAQSDRLSDATPEVLEQQLRNRQRPAGAIAVDTTKPLDWQVAEVLRELEAQTDVGASGL